MPITINTDKLYDTDLTDAAWALIGPMLPAARRAIRSKLRRSTDAPCCGEIPRGDPLAEAFLRGNIKQGDTVEVHVAHEQLAFKVTRPEQSEPANGRPLRNRGRCSSTPERTVQ